MYAKCFVWTDMEGKAINLFYISSHWVKYNFIKKNFIALVIKLGRENDYFCYSVSFHFSLWPRHLCFAFPTYILFWCLCFWNVLLWWVWFPRICRNLFFFFIFECSVLCFLWILDSICRPLSGTVVHCKFVVLSRQVPIAAIVKQRFGRIEPKQDKNIRFFGDHSIIWTTTNVISSGNVNQRIYVTGFNTTHKNTNIIFSILLPPFHIPPLISPFSLPLLLLFSLSFLFHHLQSFPYLHIHILPRPDLASSKFKGKKHNKHLFEGFG